MTADKTLQVTGMHCESCAQRLSRALERHDGVLRADVDPAGQATVRFDRSKVNDDQLRELVHAAGFDLV